MVAGGVSAYDDSVTDDLDPKIGQLKFYLKHWDYRDLSDYKQGIQFTEVPSKPCPTQIYKKITNEDHNDIESTGFYHVDYHSRPDV